MKKYDKEAQGASNEIVIENVEYGIGRNNNAKIAIYASISKPYWRLDELYIKEKLQAVRDVDKWLGSYIREAEIRSSNGQFTEEQIKRFVKIKETLFTLFN